jgi:hypothetical protein
MTVRLKSGKVGKGTAKNTFPTITTVSFISVREKMFQLFRVAL